MNYFKKIKDRYTYSLILLRQMVITDFKLRYQGSVLGYVWSLLRPLFMFAILYVVFVKFLRIGGDIPHYPVYLLTGIVLWNFFSEITSNGVSAIVSQGDLLRQRRAVYHRGAAHQRPGLLPGTRLRAGQPPGGVPLRE